MQLATICLILMLQAGKNECGLKSHAELIRLAIKADNKIKDLIHKVSGFVKGNSEFKDNYENLRIPLMENYTSLPTKLVHIREFKVYNMERLNLEERIKSAISKLHTPISDDCKNLSTNLRKHMLLMLVATNKKKIDALHNFENGSCQMESSSPNIKSFSDPAITSIPTTKIYGNLKLTNKFVNNLQTEFFKSSVLQTFASKNICKSSLNVSDICLTTETKMAYTSSMPSVLTEDPSHHISPACETHELLSCRKFVIISFITGECCCPNSQKYKIKE
ncbi:uncharacterized protein LOC26526646, partial [Drosophila erecta]|uniref:uncharacterized protein LOC26526646 n=1 Tax=Drosophila erecta TaxID=7220 RepID=UPI000F04760E